MSIDIGLGILERDAINKGLSEDVADYKLASLKKFSDFKRKHSGRTESSSMSNIQGVVQQRHSNQHTVKFSESSPTLVNDDSLSDFSSSHTYSMILNSLHIPTRKMSSLFCNKSSNNFKNNELHSLQKTRNRKVYLPQKSLKELVDMVFQEVPFENDQFVDELQYSIISSKFFVTQGADDYKRMFSVPIQKSVLDFGKSTHLRTTLSDSTKPGIMTKYGYLRVKEKKLVLNKFISSYYKTHMFIYSMLKRYYRNPTTTTATSTTGRDKKMFLCLLIQMYLNLQQETFFNKYMKYSTLLTIKSTVKRLENLNVLLQKFENTYKEMITHKNFESSYDESHEIDRDLIEESHLIQQLQILLKSTIYPIYQNIIQVIEELVPFINQSTLQKHCDLFSIDLTSVYNYYKFVNIEQDLDFHIMSFRNLIKFFFVSMISLSTASYSEIVIEQNNISVSHEMNTFFQNLFGEEKYRGVRSLNDFGKLLLLKQRNLELQKFIEPFQETLMKKRHMFFSVGGYGTSFHDTHDQYGVVSRSQSPVFDYAQILMCEQDQMFQREFVSQIMESLNLLSNEILQSNKIKMSTTKFKAQVTNDLNHIQGLWDKFLMKTSDDVTTVDKNDLKNYKKKNYGKIEKQNVYALNQDQGRHKREQSGGFQLNVLDVDNIYTTTHFNKRDSLKPLNSYIIDSEGPERTNGKKLGTPIEFIQVDDHLHEDFLEAVDHEIREPHNQEYSYGDETNPHHHHHQDIKNNVFYTEASTGGGMVETLHRQKDAHIFAKPPGIDKFKTLSDEELRKKLDEKIHTFSMENKKKKKAQRKFQKSQRFQNQAHDAACEEGAFEVRTQKSFDLLSLSTTQNQQGMYSEYDVQHHHQEQHAYTGSFNKGKGLKYSQSTPHGLNILKSRPNSNEMFKEESIPALYELNKILFREI